MRLGWFELRYLMAAPITLCLLAQYALGYAIWRALFDRQRSKRAYLVMGPWAAIFAVQNCLYNQLVATFIFWDRPREIMTSDRMKRYRDAGDVYGAKRMINALNYFDPGHI